MKDQNYCMNSLKQMTIYFLLLDQIKIILEFSKSKAQIKEFICFYKKILFNR